MVLFSMLNGAISLDSVSRLKKENMQDYDGVSLSILMRNIGKRRDYVFNIHQSEPTSRQLKVAISSGVRSVFKSHIDELEFEPDEFVRSMWVACVVRSGLSASEALGYVGDSAPYSIPEFCTPASVPKWVNKYNLRAFYRLFHEKGLWCRLYNVLIEFPILFTWDTLRTKLY